MSSEAPSTDENSLSSYRINHCFVQSKLLVFAEHHRTKKVYRTEIDQAAINSITQGVCDKCEQLFDLLQELINNDGKTNNASLQLQEEETKLILNVTFVVVFGQTSREFQMKLEVESVQLDNITRLEQLEWSAHDRFDRASKLVSLLKNDFHFRNVASSSDHAALSDNNQTMRCQTHKHQEQHHHTSHTLTYGIAASSTCTVDTTTGPVDEKDTFLVGIVSEPDMKQWDRSQLSVGSWAFDACNGAIQYSASDTRPYTCSLEKLDTLHHVDVVLDTHHRPLAFRVDDQTEDQWAFYLPKQSQIDQLYPFIVLNHMNISVSIAQ